MSTELPEPQVAVASQPDQLYVRLRFWLASEDIYTSPFVSHWLERTPKQRAADVLAEVSIHAGKEPRALIPMMLSAYMMAFSTSEVVTDKSPAGRKSGVRAAMLLANLEDPRCIAPLVRVFEPHWYWAGKYQETIEKALLKYLNGEAAQNDPGLAGFAPDLQRLIERIWRSGGGRRDLTPRLADLAVAALQTLNQTDPNAAKTISAMLSTSRSNLPNRSRVRAAVAPRA